MNIVDAFNKILLYCFDFDYYEYLKKKGLRFTIIKIVKIGSAIDYINIDGDCDESLIKQIEESKSSLSNVKAAFSSHMNGITTLPNSMDILLLSEEIFQAEDSRRLCILYHEACHLIIENEIEHKYEFTNCVKEKAKKIKGCTQYQCGDDNYHTLEWFSLLYAASEKMKQYLNFTTQQAIINEALFYDKYEEIVL